MGRYCHHTYWCKVVETAIIIILNFDSKFGCVLYVVCLDQFNRTALHPLHSAIMSSSDMSFPMPSASADLVTTWAFLQEGVDHIMTKLQTGVSYSKVILEISVYSLSYRCITVHGPIHRCLQLLHIFKDAWKHNRDDWNREQK